MSLRDVPSLRVAYRTGESDLARDFYTPCLTQAVQYSRAVGYFSSFGLAHIAKGVAALVRNGGKMRLIASPVLDSADIDAIRKGIETPLTVLQRVAATSLGDVESLLARDRLNALAWLIADGRLSVRVALRKDSSGNYVSGLYHEKIGIFTDSQGNDVGFSGSSNETLGGMQNNFESIQVFWSWDDPHGRIADQKAHFERLWTNSSTGVEVSDITPAVALILEKFKRSVPPMPELSDEELPPTVSSSRKFSRPGWLDLRDYQKQAIREWLDREGRGIWEMATGAGKTYTALSAAAALYGHLQEKKQALVTVIICPYLNLARQWVRDLRAFGANPIECFEGKSRWLEALQDGYAALATNIDDNLVIVVSNKTFLTAAFQGQLQPGRFHHLIVADEVHNLGAENLQSKLDDRFKFRLGLSATPERHGDEAGTAVIKAYFGDVIYRFSLKDALARGILCPYQYFPIPVELTDDEAQEYQELSKEIGRLMSFNGESPSLRFLLLKRARLLASAANKMDALKDVLASLSEPVKKAIFYCGDGRVESDAAEDGVERQIAAVTRLVGDNFRLHVRKFTCEESGEDREAILRALRADDLDAVVAIRCLDEGIDVPDIRMAFILASSTNPRQFIQRRGRVLRRAAGKDRALIWDFVVIPPDWGDQQGAFNLERKLFARELERIVEFCECAENGAQALASLRDLRLRYNLLAA
jgi:DNA phosphorothioation system restriction enzyme